MVVRTVTCSCGDTRDHEVARRSTADGVHVVLWASGAIAGTLGLKLPGVPMRNPSTPEAQQAAVKAGRLLLGECSLWDAADLPGLYAACEWAAKRDGLPGTVRARHKEILRPKVRPTWTVTSADRDGRWTERQWILPRLMWPGGLVVIQRRGCPYELCHFLPGSRETVGSSGLTFPNLPALAAHLEEHRLLNRSM